MEAPSPGLVNVLDWLEDTSVRKLTVGLETAEGDVVNFPRSSDVLREAYAKSKAKPE